MSQVRDMTSLRDNEGRLVALPALEDALAGCLDAIRNIQVQRPQNKRFDTNRILMYVWPPAELSMDELNALVQRILPTTAGDRKSTRLNSSHVAISYAVSCLK